MGLANDRPRASQVSTSEASQLIFMCIVMLTLDLRIPSIHISCHLMWENKYSSKKQGVGPALPFSCHKTLAKYLCTQSLDFLIYHPEVMITFYQIHRTFWKRREGHARRSCMILNALHLCLTQDQYHTKPTCPLTHTQVSACVCINVCVCVCVSVPVSSMSLWPTESRGCFPPPPTPRRGTQGYYTR